MISGATIPLVLMSVAAPVGAFDVLYFHLWKFRLYARRESRNETCTHVFRGLLVGAVVFIIANFEPRGAWFWLVACAIVADFVNNIVDVVLEPASRAGLGGLPRAEYMVHIIGSTLSGAVGALFIVLDITLSELPTGLVEARNLPAWLVWNGNAVAIGSTAIALIEATLLLRTALRPNARPSSALA